MDEKKIIKMLAEAYPGIAELIPEYGQCVDLTALSRYADEVDGDTLMVFIIREMKDMAQYTQSEAEACEAIKNAMVKAAGELSLVAKTFRKAWIAAKSE